jgi:hypothetical protein
MSLLSFFNGFIANYRFNYDTLKKLSDHYFFDLKYYLKQDASIEGFSHLLNISTEQLDQISKAHYSNSLDLLLNEYRYGHFLNEIQSPINDNLSLESIFKLCGFENNEKYIEYVQQKKDLFNQTVNKI